MICQVVFAKWEGSALHLPCDKGNSAGHGLPLRVLRVKEWVA